MPQTRKRMACDISDAQITISQRELLSLAPGTQAEVARAATRPSALPEDRAMFLVQNVTPQLMRDRE